MRVIRTALMVLLAAMLGREAAVFGQSPSFKVYISVDMEGIAGVVGSSQLSPGAPDYALGRRLMTAEANAAIAAASEAGATAIVVSDSHGSHTNLQPDELDRRAALITGRPRPFGMMQGIDPSFAAVIFIGYHAQAGTMDGVLDHTFNRQIKGVKINGREVGEYGLNAALAGHFGVPVVFLSGDGAVTEQAKAFIRGVEVVAVKEGIGRTAARTLHPEEARERIAAGVKAALARLREISPVEVSRPVTIAIELASSAQADSAMMVPGMKRSDGRTVSYEAADMAAAYKVSVLVAQLANE